MDLRKQKKVNQEQKQVDKWIKRKIKKYIHIYKKKLKIKNTYVYPYISSEHKEIKTQKIHVDYVYYAKINIR